MIVKNTTMHARCKACKNIQGRKKVVDTYFKEDDSGNCVVVMFRCQNCGGTTKATFRLWESSYFSGPLNAIYKKGKL